MIVIAVAGGDRILDIAELVRRHFPNVKIAARAIDRSHAHQLMALGVEAFERETFRAAIALGEKALVTLGHAPDEARRLAEAFEDHDERGDGVGARLRVLHRPAKRVVHVPPASNVARRAQLQDRRIAEDLGIVRSRYDVPIGSGLHHWDRFRARKVRVGEAPHDERLFHAIQGELRCGSDVDRHRYVGLEVDERVFASESATNSRNQALARLLQSYGRLDADPGETVELYTRQCSLLVTARDIAVMGATLADGGVNPVTRERVVSAEVARDTLAVLAANGLYERSGEWLFQIGLPAKSGVSGGIVAVAPGKGAIGTFSPRLDEAGNSVRGERATAYLSRTLGLNIFASIDARATEGKQR